MKKLQTPLFLIFIGILFCVASCKKEAPDPPPDLPPLTNVGAMTFGCYVNGEPWVAEVPPFQFEFRHTGGSYSIQKNRFIVFATRKTQEANESINIVFPLDTLNTEELDLIYLKQYYINLKNECNDKRGDYYFELDTLSTQNKVKITHLNFQDRIVSGIFSFVAKNKICKDSVVIKKGRFDVMFSVIE